MPLTVVPVAIAIAQILGTPLPNAVIAFELTGADINVAAGVVGPLVAPQRQTVALDADGTGSIALWPNALGNQGTRYKVTVTDAQGRQQALGYATLPNGACNLVDVLTLTPGGVDSTALSAAAAQAALVATRTLSNLILVGA